MKRRRFITATAATLGLSGAGWFAWRFSSAYMVARPSLQGLFGDNRRIRELGKAYRRSHPGEDDIATLVALITANAPDADLDLKVSRDFEQDDTVQLQGWILSRTEARQCALFSLLNPW